MAGRADKKRNVDKVTASRVNNPLATQQEVAKETGLSQSSVDRADKEVGKNGLKDDRIISLTDDDFLIVRKTQELTKKKLDTEEEKISARDLSYIGDVSAKRYSIFRGDMTDEKGALRPLQGKSLEELEGMLD